MAFNKFSASQLFTGHDMLDERQVLVTDEAGIVQAIINRDEAGGDVQEHEGVLCPGFINVHCHLELSHMRGAIPGHTGLVDFVLNVMRNRHSDESFILAAMEKAEDEMLANGIVAVGDICNNSLSIAQKSKGRLHYHNFIEVSGFTPAVADTRFEQAKQILGEYNKLSTLNLEHSTYSPHAPYSVSSQLFSMINNETQGEVVSIHNQETEAENEFFQTGTGEFKRLYEALGIDISHYQPVGKTSLQAWLPYFDKEQSLILVHNVSTSAEDIQFAAGKKPFYCLCPNANQYISNSMPPVELLLNNNCSIVLGTDSLASNHQLSILEEIKTLRRHFPQLHTNDLLHWATANGAKALRMDDKLGSFEKGKQPGVLLLDEEISAVSRLI